MVGKSFVARSLIIETILAKGDLVANITIKDVAKKAGVGVGTVSRVLNQSPSVSDQTRQKVLTAIEELEYTPDPVARKLSLGRSMIVSVMAPFFIRPSYVERLRGIVSVLSDSEYDFVFYNVETVQRRDVYFREIPRRHQADGLIIMSLTPNDEIVHNFRRAKIPTVLIDCHSHKLNRVVIDDIDGGFKATQHLIELGHQKIAYINDYMSINPFDFRPIRDRYQGYRKALAVAGIDFRPEYYREGRLSRVVAQQQALELLSMPDPPTAIFAYSDTQAFGVMRAAEDLGIDVPGQVSIIGFDDIEISEHIRLTTVRQLLFESGALGARLLLEELQEGVPKAEEFVLPTELIIRKTTGPSP